LSNLACRGPPGRTRSEGTTAIHKAHEAGNEPTRGLGSGKGLSRASGASAHGVTHLAVRQRLDAPAGPGDCPGGAGCALTGLPRFPIEVRRFESRNIGRAIGATGFGLGVGTVIAAVACGLGCRDGSTPKQASEVTMGVLGVAIVGGLVWLVISCAGGQGCRD
jgi:hypothetical protein